MSSMYLLLLVFGAVLSVAGVVLALAGISVHDRTFDAALVTPGVVAVVGGCLLIGLGFALRVLQQIEHALSVRPMPRAARPGETTDVAAVASAGEPTRGSFPVKITRLPQTATVSVPTALAAEKVAHELPQKFPSVVRGPAVVPPDEDIEPFRRPGPPPMAEEMEESAPPPLFARRIRNGGAASANPAPRLDLRGAATVTRPKGPAFDALWPKATRPVRAAAQSVASPAAAVSEPISESMPERLAPEPEPAVEPERGTSSMVVPEEETPVPVSILKSGVVDGMAYTLFSDGSIEAQLPQGTLRFGSIAELRAHIEQDSQG